MSVKIFDFYRRNTLINVITNSSIRWLNYLPEASFFSGEKPTNEKEEKILIENQY
jgi:hypothetical protein